MNRAQWATLKIMLLIDVVLVLFPPFQRSRHHVSDVAYLLGFSGSSAFSRWFRERFGCSPTSWRIAGHGTDSVEMISL